MNNTAQDQSYSDYTDSSCRVFHFSVEKVKCPEPLDLHFPQESTRYIAVTHQRALCWRVSSSKVQMCNVWDETYYTMKPCWTRLLARHEPKECLIHLGGASRRSRKLLSHPYAVRNV